MVRASKKNLEQWLKNRSGLGDKGRFEAHVTECGACSLRHHTVNGAYCAEGLALLLVLNTPKVKAEKCKHGITLARCSVCSPCPIPHNGKPCPDAAGHKWSHEGGK